MVTRNLFGARLEEKASDAFCLNMLRGQEAAGPRSAAFLESMVAPIAGAVTAPSVLEFADEPLAPSAGLTVAGARTAAYQQLSGVYDEVERQSGLGVLGGAASPAGEQRASVLTTQICWLNHSMRTWADPGIVAEVAGDSSVQRVDVPRLLRRDVAPPTSPPTGDDDPTGRNGHAAVGLRADLELSGEGTIVAVIDSEVAGAHPCLAGRVVHRRNFTNEPWGNPDGHGTAVAGIIASADTAFPGFARNAIVYNYKVLATNSMLNADDFGGALAVQQALEDGALVANCSWGAGPVAEGRSREARAVDAAWALGMVVVKSAGNRGPGRGTMTTPADAQGVITVGATDLLGASVQGYSSRGPAGGRPGPHLVAPGGDNGADGTGNLRCALVAGGFGDAGAGTSYAAPFVTGAVALHLDRAPGLSPDDVRDQLTSSATALSGNDDEAQGNGILQVGL